MAFMRFCSNFLLIRVVAVGEPVCAVVTASVTHDSSSSAQLHAHAPPRPFCSRPHRDCRRRHTFFLFNEKLCARSGRRTNVGTLDLHREHLLRVISVEQCMMSLRTCCADRLSPAWCTTCCSGRCMVLLLLEHTNKHKHKNDNNINETSTTRARPRSPPLLQGNQRQGQEGHDRRREHIHLLLRR
jgi:hypothetical protein